MDITGRLRWLMDHHPRDDIRSLALSIAWRRSMRLGGWRKAAIAGMRSGYPGGLRFALWCARTNKERPFVAVL